MSEWQNEWYSSDKGRGLYEVCRDVGRWTVCMRRGRACKRCICMWAGRREVRDEREWSSMGGFEIGHKW